MKIGDLIFDAFKEYFISNVIINFVRVGVFSHRNRRFGLIDLRFGQEEQIFNVSVVDGLHPVHFNEYMIEVAKRALEEGLHVMHGLPRILLNNIVVL